ncbi:hypothetical protein [Micromonospora pattaloongensis]|uniref:hypothetical protein n=1 Tax=Micromonospora pattaloongensis TaxID=405436 RepID=UPI00111512B5|nr:hypothetical protein [Micromonospora pattaloongensis]
MSTEIVAVLAALVIPALLVEPARRLALRHGLVERPARHRVFTQKRFVPRLGGVVVAAAALAPAVTVTGRLDVRLTTLLAGAATVSLLGLLRDLRRIRLPIGAATHATMAFAVAVGDVRLRLIEPSWLDLVITMLWVVGIANAFRVLDSTDGVLPTVTCATAVPLAASAFVIDQTELALLLLCLAAACAGFLLHNAPPARITMGDSGALCAGFFLAVSAAIVHSGHGSFVGLPILMLITSVVAVDAVVVAVAGRDRGWVEDGPGRPTRLGFALGPNLLLVLLVLSTAGGGLLAVLVAGGVLPAAGTVAGALLVGTTLIVLLLQKPAPAPPPQLPRIAERHVVAPARTLVKEGAQR